MTLTDTELRYFDSNILRLPEDKRSSYHEQVDRLVLNLKEKLKTLTNVKITNVVKAGSFAKYTILRKTNEDPVDVDLVFYLEDKKGNPSLDTLINEIDIALKDQYPNKSVEDFEIQKRAATITFSGTGLSVDVVPVLEFKGRPGYGIQYDVKDGSTIETCAKCQFDFVKKRKELDKDFRTLVRLSKKWRNHVELTHLKSYTIELILAYLLDNGKLVGNIEKKFLQFLQFIAQTELSEKIFFKENNIRYTEIDDPVVIIDPFCETNNVASRITEGERKEIVSAATEAWETCHFASTELELDVWKEIFGPRFKTEE